MPDALGTLGLWLGRRHAAAGGLAADPVRPPGHGPLILLASPDPEAHGPRSVLAALHKGRPDLRLATLGRAGLPDATDDAAAPIVVDSLRPDLVLLLGDILPAGLVEAAVRRHIPVVLADARVPDPSGGLRLRGMMRAAMRRHVLRELSLLMLADPASRHAALQQGVSPPRVRVTGPVTEIRDPLRCTEAERTALAGMFRGRHVWLAVALPEEEEAAMIDAHRAALRYSHRALLIVVPDLRQRAAPLVARLEGCGFAVALRSAEDEPTDEVQILVADDPAEMGLWYRLAPVTYLGGTLTGAATAPRHPFEPAALGSAIIHGSETRPFGAETGQLDGAGATRRIDDASGLAEAVGDLAEPDIVARLAARAWSVSTGGAGVAREIAAPILDLIARREG